MRRWAGRIHEECSEFEYRQTQLQRLQSTGSGRATEVSAALVAGAATEGNTLTTLRATPADGPALK